MLPRGEAAARANRGRRFQAAAGFAPAKGTGCCFIARADKGLAFTRGLKATDRRGRKRAITRCGRAAGLARLARADAEATRTWEENNRAIEMTNRALHQYNLFLAERRKPGARPATQIDHLLEHVHVRAISLGLRRWEAALAQQELFLHRLRHR